MLKWKRPSRPTSVRRKRSCSTGSWRPTCLKRRWSSWSTRDSFRMTSMNLKTLWDVSGSRNSSESRESRPVPVSRRCSSRRNSDRAAELDLLRPTGGAEESWLSRIHKGRQTSRRKQRHAHVFDNLLSYLSYLIFYLHRREKLSRYVRRSMYQIRNIRSRPFSSVSHPNWRWLFTQYASTCVQMTFVRFHWAERMSISFLPDSTTSAKIFWSPVLSRDEIQIRAKALLRFFISCVIKNFSRCRRKTFGQILC